MPERRPQPLSAAECRARQRRVLRLARQLGFVGRVEYRHVFSSHSGGAQYGLAASQEDDLLIVYAEAFERDANPDDFALEAILAHERGHQLLARHPRLATFLPPDKSVISEEVLASLLGSLLVEREEDRQDLLLKALFEATDHGMPKEQALFFMPRLRDLLEKAL